MSWFSQESPEQRYQRVCEMIDLGAELIQQGQLAETLTAYDEAIRLGEALDLSVPQYRHVLALAHNNKCAVLLDLDTSQALNDTTAVLNEAIRLGNGLDLSVLQHRYALVLIHFNKGRYLRLLGTSQDLDAAIDAFNKAIELGKGLDLSVPEYLDILARAYILKGSTLRALGTLQDLTDAIDAFDEAMWRIKSHDRNMPQRQYTLAMIHNHKGIVLKELGTLKDLAAAIDAYNEAIRLSENLDQSVPNYRFLWVEIHNNKGWALSDLGTPQALNDAITAYDEAIRMGNTFDLSIPMYRYILALTYTNKGVTLKDSGTSQALNDAITAYDKAIRMGNGLDLNLSEYRFLRAIAYFNKCLALRKKDLDAADDACDKAIQLAKDLDQNVLQYRCFLAESHDSKGLILAALGTSKDLAAAADAYDEAIRLGETLDLKVESCRKGLIGTYTNKGNLPTLSPQVALDLFQKAIDLADGGRGLSITGIEFTAKAYLGAAGAYLRLADPVNAADAADEGLSLLRELEIQGVFKLRSLRESLFVITLDAYVQAQQFRWMPEIIREHLDPDQRGSAPASEAMHAAALRALIQSLRVLYQTPRTAVAVAVAVAVADLLADLETLATQLAGWRTRYFSGEASSAWLRAQDCEKRGRPEQADQILHAYIQARPLDPCGPKVLGDLYAQRRQPAAAEAAYRDAVRVCARGTPPKDDLHTRSIGVVTLARCLLDLRLLQLSDAAPTTATAPDPIKTLGESYDQLHTLLTGDFVHDLVNHSPPDLKGLWWERLKPELEALWQRAAAQRDDWLTKHAQGLVQKERDQAFETVLTLTKGLFQGLGRSWQDYQQAVLCALQEIWDYQTARSNQPDLEEFVATAVREAVERSACALADSELQAPYEDLHQALEPLWDRVLEDREKRFLGCGWRGLQHGQDEDMRRFAGLNLGLAVEWSLAHRLYEPLKVYWSQSGKPDLGTHRLAPQIDRFLTRSNQHLMLGEMTGALNSALKHAHKQPEGLRGLIVACLRQMPNASTLLNANESTRAHRRRQLELINACRIDCAHPEPPPSQEQLETLWAAVAADPEHAFFRYFGAALLPPSDRVAST